MVVIGKDGIVHSEDEEDGEVGGKEANVDPRMAYSSGEEENEELRTLVVLKIY